METKEGASYRGPGKWEGEMTGLESLQYGAHIHTYICICMHGKPIYKLHTQTYYNTQK